MSATSRRNRSIDSRVVNPKGLGRYIGSKETAMQTTRFERMALARIFVAGWVAFFSLAIEHAQPHYPEPPPPQPPPTFNPSTPYTVPQSPETPVSPGLPSALPRSSEGVSPSGGSPPGAVARSHRRPVTATGTSNVAKTHESRHSPRRHPRNWSRGSQTADSEVLDSTSIHSCPTAGECAVHSNPRTDVMPSGLLVRIDAGAS